MRYYIFLIALSLFTFPDSLSAQFRHKLFDINPQAGKGSYPSDFTVFQNKLYFFATDSAHGTELWVYEYDTVRRITDIFPGPASSCIFNILNGEYSRMAAAGEGLYFVVRRGANNYHLYRYTGSDTPHSVYDLRGSDDLVVRQMIAVNNKIYLHMAFNGERQLTVVDPVTNIITPLPLDSNVRLLFFSKLFYWKKYNRLYFNGAHSKKDYRLFYYDLNNGKTVAINTPVKLDWMFNAKALNDHFYFKDIEDKWQLYECNKDSTVRIISEAQHIKGGFANNDVLDPYEAFCFMNDKVYFSARDRKTEKFNLYEYNPKNGNILYVQSLKNDSAARAMFTHRNKIFFYNAGGLWVNDLKNPPYTVHSVNPAIPFTFCNETNLFSVNDTLYGSVHLSNGDGKARHNHEFVVFYDSTLSVEQHHSISAPLSATLYPNPTTSDAYLDVTLKDAQTIHVCIVDMNGRTVYQLQPRIYSSGQHTINLRLQNLAPGIYTYHITDKENMLLQAGKLLKQ